LFTIYPIWPDLGLNPGRGGKPATNRLSYGTANLCFWTPVVTCWVCHVTNNFMWVSDSANLYWTLTLPPYNYYRLWYHSTSGPVLQYSITQLSLSMAGSQLSSMAAQDCLFEWSNLLISAAVATHWTFCLHLLLELQYRDCFSLCNGLF
jgi:hypothetical protein